MVEKIKQLAESKQPENRYLAVHLANSAELNDADLTAALGSLFDKMISIKSNKERFNHMLEMNQISAKLFLSWLGNL